MSSVAHAEGVRHRLVTMIVNSKVLACMTVVRYAVRVSITAIIMARHLSPLRKVIVQMIGYQPITGGLMLRQFELRIVPIHSACK
ncbi:hypothetical protein N7537_010442 [Penicillium hordei]|uniref:Uncharacterized protein n=1 Tax=Penicillium hordei TaxID=40994 RepID=A0AAD6DUN5_9EURO|nr:uncharacterized protein N7537_010442 [Penicillium hordei]KAJ5593538.1 hypothetical protein N7537_010442 [Penicillium hordei]